MKKNPKTSRQVRSKAPAAANPRAELLANQVVISQAELALFYELRKTKEQTTREYKNLRKSIGYRLANGAEVEKGPCKPKIVKTERRQLSNAKMRSAFSEEEVEWLKEEVEATVVTYVLIECAEPEAAE